MQETMADRLERIEAELATIGKTVPDLCAEARIAHTTWWRWRRGEYEPTMRLWRRVEEALAALKTASCADVGRVGV